MGNAGAGQLCLGRLALEMYARLSLVVEVHEAKKKEDFSYCLMCCRLVVQC